jgi:dihydroorotase
VTRVVHYLGGPVAEITIRKPFDMHHHVRVGEILKIVGPMLAKRFAGAIIMPNTIPPVTTAARVGEYRSEVMEQTGPDFRPLMTMYLTDMLKPSEVEQAIIVHDLAGVKYYPRGLTTNSDSGVEDPASLWTSGTLPFEVLRMLRETRRVLLLHAADGFDKNGVELDPYEQEPHFLRETLPRIRDAHPGLRISVEHMSTAMAAELAAKEANEDFGFSLTSHHMLIDRRDTHRGGFNGHRFWIPPPQAPEHCTALLTLAASGNPYVWLGSDSAPHPLSDKEAACCKGGVMTVHAGIELYAEAFDKIGALDKLEAFASLNGPRFYGIEPSSEEITLRRESWRVSQMFCFETMPNDSRDGLVRPFRLGEMIEWKLV